VIKNVHSSCTCCVGGARCSTPLPVTAAIWLATVASVAGPRWPASWLAARTGDIGSEMLCNELQGNNIAIGATI
jgi:hypothetical protein